MEKHNIAILGGGCFWCTEAIFKRVKGVISVMPGYAGGSTPNPTYDDVSSGKTGHAEVAKITFDPTLISYGDLLDVFWELHDPTTPNRQGADVGTQYRSIILTTTDEQYSQAEASTLNAQAKMKQPIVTEIKPLEAFYPAENYHHDYFEKHKDAPYCRIVISPKLDHLKQRFPEKLALNV